MVNVVRSQCEVGLPRHWVQGAENDTCAPIRPLFSVVLGITECFPGDCSNLMPITLNAGDIKVLSTHASNALVVD